MVNEQEEIKLGYLLDPAFQLVNTRGAPLTNGWIEVYIHGTRNKYYCYSDFGGTLHPFKIPLDSLGSNIVLADPERAYDVYVYNHFGSLVMSRYNVSPGHAGGAAISSGGNAEHWIGRYGDSISVEANEFSDSIPLPIEPDYEGTFIDHISDNKNIVLKDGLYLVDCLLSFRQNPDSLNNTLGYVHVFTGLDDGESGVFQRNETLPDTDPDEIHNIRVQFIRHVEGSTGCNVCFQVRTTNAWSFVRIQGLSIVKLGAGGGIAPQPIEYDAGQYVSIENDVISVTGLQPAGNYADASSVSQGFYDVNQQLNALSGQINEVSGQIPSLDGYATEQYVQSQVSGKADKSEIPSLEGYATEEWVRQQNYLTEVPSQYVTESELNSAISGKADKSEIPSLDGYATESYVQSAVSGKQDELTFTYDSENKITTIDGHGIAGTGGGGGSGAVYTPGQYISIQNDIISVTGLQESGDYVERDDLNGYATTEDVEAAVSGKADVSAIPSVAGLASESYVNEHIEEATSGKADVSAIPSLEGYATESWVNEQGFLKEVPQGYATTEDVDSATSGKMDKSQSADFYPMASNPSGYLTEHQSLAGYATQEWVNQQNFVDDDDLRAATSGKADVSAIPSVSGLASETFVTEHIEEATSGKADVSAIPSLNGYATQNWVQEQGYLTSVPSQYATDAEVEAATSGKMDSSAYTAPVNPDWNATSGLAQILNKPNLQEYTAGDGIAINSGAISVNIGKNLAFESPKAWIELNAERAQTGPSSYGFSLLGQLDSTMVAALKAGQVNFKPNFNYTTSYSNLDHHFAICKKSAYNQPDYNNCLGSTPTLTLDGSTVLKADENYIVDFSSIDPSSTASWAAIEADPTSYYLAAVCWYSNTGISSWVGWAYANNATGHPGQIEVADPTAPKVLYAVDQGGGGGGGSSIPLSAGPGVKLQLVDDHVEASLEVSGYVWQSASLFHTDNPVTQTSYTLSDSCQNYDKLEVDFYDINGWRTQMDCPIPPGLANSGTRGGYFSVVTETSATNSPIWFKAFNWSAFQTTWRCYCSELAGTGGSTSVGVNANQPGNPPKVVGIIGWKRVPIS